SEKFLPVLSTSRRRRHFVVPLRVQVIFVLGLFRARIARPSVRFAVVYHLTLGSSPFSCFVVALKAPWFIRTARPSSDPHAMLDEPGNSPRARQRRSNAAIETAIVTGSAALTPNSSVF